MADKDRDYGANIIEDPRRPGKLYVKVYHAGVVYKRRAASLSHARDLVDEIKAAIVKGEWPRKAKPRPVRFDELLDDYRTAKAREGKVIYGGELGWRRLLERFGGRRADAITDREVEEWRDALLELETLSPASVNKHQRMLGAILNRGVRDRKIARDTLPAIKMLKENNKRNRHADEDEERRLLDALPAFLHPLIEVELNTGLRRGELLNLKWRDIVFAGGAIHVREAKSGEGRSLPMNSAARAALLGLRDERRGRLRARVVNRSEASGYVFTAPGGGYLHDLNRYWYAALKKAGIEDFHFHNLATPSRPGTCSVAGTSTRCKSCSGTRQRRWCSAMPIWIASICKPRSSDWPHLRRHLVPRKPRVNRTQPKPGRVPIGVPIERRLGAVRCGHVLRGIKGFPRSP